MIIQSFNFLPKRIVGQFREWIFISMRAPKQLLFLSIFWRIKKHKSNPLILSLRNISDLCFSPFFYIISSFILDFILLTSFNKLFTGLKTWEYNSSTSLARGGLQVGLQCCCCASVQCLKVFINFRPYELLFHIQIERESDREQKTGCRVQSSYGAFVKSPVRCDFLIKIEGKKKQS